MTDVLFALLLFGVSICKLAEVDDEEDDEPDVAVGEWSLMSTLPLKFPLLLLCTPFFSIRIDDSSSSCSPDDESSSSP